MVYIFGYGSLIDTRCRQHTFPTEQAYPARILGYRRHWSRLDEDSICCAVAIKSEEGSLVNGVLIPFDETYLDELDEREVSYRRIEVNLSQLEFLQGDMPMPSRVYAYVVDDILLPNETVPIAQSYLDLCLRGSLQFGEGFAQEFLESTHSWGHWINDRHKPAYVRAETLTYELEQMIDQLLCPVKCVSRTEPMD